MAKTKHIPMRKCVGCNTSFDKRELIRLSDADGTCVVDTGGKMDGRGTYLCKQIDCLELALKRKSINRAMKMNVTTENAESLRKKFKAFARDSEVSE